MTDTRPIALTIAGSDSGGGAGIQADLKTFHAFGVYGTSVLTAVTAQNTLGVTAVHAVPLDVVRAQVDAVVDDLPPKALKTGMLATAELVRTVAAAIRRHALHGYVLDPVMVATSGDRLLDADAEETLARELLPLATLVTPNLHEARILTGRDVRSLDDMRDAARALLDLGAGAALVKGGHLEGDAVDLFWDGAQERVWRKPRLQTRHTHGTGCTLSAAVAAGLALGRPLAEAAEAAVLWVARAIETAPGLGRGHGPVNHFYPAD
ncbi:MAG: hydroxymethylpyrimidine/phosphomethylpyrimidine kinase [Gemmatimonadota bacterium]